MKTSEQRRPQTTLALAGRLESVALSDVLQILAISGRSGILRVESDDALRSAEIELVGGRIVRAEMRSRQERIGTVLVKNRTLDPDRLGEALRRQSAAAPWKPLGTVLLEMGAVEPGDLATGLAEQIESTIAEVLAWETGVFRFRLPGSADARTEPTALLGVALDAHELLLLAAQRCDESRTSADAIQH